MSALLEVIEPGLHTTVQDRGRLGYQALGVPVAGALDPVALHLVNALVGNEPDCAALEFLYSGPELAAVDGAVRVAAACAGITLAGDNAQVVPAWQSVTIKPGERFRIGTPRDSGCGYLAIAGGLALAPVLGSLSTYTRSRIGGVQGRALRAGDRLPLLRTARPVSHEQRLAQPPPLAAAGEVRVVPGPQAEYFTDAALRTFLDAEYTVSKQADRMGLRLDGPKLDHSHGYDIVSDGIVTGAIQVPGSGQPIVLLADHQTTGGYPKIATVISADVPALGRCRPGDRLRFRAVSVEEAEAAARTLWTDVGRRARALARAAGGPLLDEAALFGSNLISGAVNALD